MVDNAYVTLITNEYYYHGAVALGVSLCKTGSKCRKVVLVSENVAADLRNNLASIWDDVIEVKVLDSKDLSHLSLIGRPELGVTFSKLHIWELVQFKKCVFLDADTIVLQNIDELFCRDELSAAPDIGWPDCFNSGVFVFKPSIETYHNLLQLARDVGSFDGADQGLLNSYWDNWANEHDKRLPFTFNVAINMSYFYNAAILKFKRDIRVIHYLGLAKPWLRPCHKGMSQDINSEFYAKWWEFYNDKDAYINLSKEQATKPDMPVDPMHVYTVLPDVTVEHTEHTEEIEEEIILVAEVSAHEVIEEELVLLEPELDLRVESPVRLGPVEIVIDEKQWQLDWQRGHIEVEGKDSSDSIIENILAKLK